MSKSDLDKARELLDRAALEPDPAMHRYYTEAARLAIERAEQQGGKR